MKYATCHPERKHLAKGLCASCYQLQYQRRTGYKRAFVPSKCHPDKAHVADGLCRACYQAKYSVRTQYVRKNNYAKNYKLTIEEYDVLFEAQDGHCAICGNGGDRWLDVDHDHETGRLRGLLCRRCNMGLGALGDSVESLQRAIDYLKGV